MAACCTYHQPTSPSPKTEATQKSLPLSLTFSVKETVIVLEWTNKAEIRPEEQSEKSEYR